MHCRHELRDCRAFTNYLSGWSPLPSLVRTDGDTTLILVAANSVYYYGQTLDPFFLAIYNMSVSVNPITQDNFYAPSIPVSPMGCVDQYQIQDPTTNQTTSLVGLAELQDSISTLSLNAAQMVTAWRLWYYFSRSSTYSSVYGTGPSALKMSDSILNFGGPAPPVDQWQTEVEGWFQTSLAKIQAYAVEYTSNTADLGPRGFVQFPLVNGTTESAWKAQCRNQKIRSTGSYQTFSFFGLIFTASVGAFIIILAFCLKSIVHGARKLFYGNEPDILKHAYTADGKYQTQRMLFETLGYGSWRGCMDDSPWCANNARMPIPINVGGLSVQYPRSSTPQTSPATSRSNAQDSSIQLTSITPQANGPTPGSAPVPVPTSTSTPASTPVHSPPSRGGLCRRVRSLP